MSAHITPLLHMLSSCISLSSSIYIQSFLQILVEMQSMSLFASPSELMVEENKSPPFPLGHSARDFLSHVYISIRKLCSLSITSYSCNINFSLSAPSYKYLADANNNWPLIIIIMRKILGYNVLSITQLLSRHLNCLYLNMTETYARNLFFVVKLS